MNFDYANKEKAKTVICGRQKDLVSQYFFFYRSHCLIITEVELSIWQVRKRFFFWNFKNVYINFVLSTQKKILNADLNLIPLALLSFLFLSETVCFEVFRF